MIDKIDVHDLPEEQAKVVREITEQIRSNVNKMKDNVRKKEDAIHNSILTPVKSDVIGRFSRKDIYDDEYFSRRVSGH